MTSPSVNDSQKFSTEDGDNKHLELEPTAMRRSGERRFLPIGLAGVAILAVAVASYFVFLDKGGDGAEEREAANRGGSSSAVAGHESGSEVISVAAMSEPQSALSAAERWEWYDPRNDGWDTEVVNEVAGKQLAELAHLFEHGGAPETSEFAPLVADDFSCGHLRPADVDEVFGDSRLRTTDGRIETSPLPGLSAEPYRGPAGLRSALEEALGRLAGADDLHCKFKLFNVELQDRQFFTRQFFRVSGHVDGKTIEQNSTWYMRWSRGLRGGPPLIQWIGVEQFEEITGDLPQGRLFADCTDAVLVGTEAYHEQFAYGIDHWRARIERPLGVEFDGQHGLIVGDVNGDGLEDVYVCQPGSLPNRLLLQQADGTVSDVSAASGADIMNFSQGALFLDLDNDGDQDIVVSTHQGTFFLANDGRGVFALKTTFPGKMAAYSLAAADYDEDGDLDIFFCRYNREDVDPSQFPAPIPYQDATNGGRNYLLRNEGGWAFSDATEEIGLEVNNSRYSFAAAWEDYDRDGDLDLYVANDFGRNNLYRNEGGTFVDVAASAGLEDGAFGMSVSWGDYDLDGLMDVYVGNMFSAAGNRISYQRKFKPLSSAQVRSQLQRVVRGNSLFKNMGDGTFADVSVEAGVTMGLWSWASLFADINNDGWEDLLVANGYVTSHQPDDL